MIFINDEEPEPDRSNMVKREQLIAAVDETLSLDINACHKANQGSVNELTRC